MSSDKSKPAWYESDYTYEQDTNLKASDDYFTYLQSLHLRLITLRDDIHFYKVDPNGKSRTNRDLCVARMDQALDQMSLLIAAETIYRESKLKDAMH